MSLGVEFFQYYRTNLKNQKKHKNLIKHFHQDLWKYIKIGNLQMKFYPNKRNINLRKRNQSITQKTNVVVIADNTCRSKIW